MSRCGSFIAGVLLFVALTLRLVNLTAFDPLYDETITKGVVENIWKGDLRNNWKFAEIPADYRIDLYNFSSYMYADAAFSALVHPLTAHAPLVRTDCWVFPHRLFSALAGTLALCLFYLVTLRWFGQGAALVSLAFMAAAPLLVQDAHYARPEAFVILLVGLAYLLSSMVAAGTWPITALAGASVCLGFLAACKFSLAPMALLPLAFVSVRLVRDWHAAVRTALIWAGAWALGMYLGVPDGFRHPRAFWSGVQFLSRQYAGVHRPHGQLSDANTFGLIVSYFWQTLGPVTCLLLLAGAAALLRKRRIVHLASILLPIVFYVAVFSTQRTFFERNLSHILPLMLVLCAVGLGWIVDCLRSATSSRWIPSSFGVLLFLGAILPPALLSGKLVFVAMSSSTEVRAKEYEDALLKKSGYRIAEVNHLLVEDQVDHFTRLAEDSDEDVLIRVLDYNDPFTAYYVAELSRHLRVEQLGYFPSLFANLSVNTLITSHSPSFRYLLLAPKPGNRSAVIAVDGFQFVRFSEAAGVLRYGRLETGSWTANGVYPEAGAPPRPSAAVSAQVFGSWAKGGDANVGTLRMGLLDPDGATAIGIPVVTGPVNRDLSIVVRDHGTGADLARMDPPPVLRRWRLWRVDLPQTPGLVIDIIATDHGATWGQWLAVGVPTRLR